MSISRKFNELFTNFIYFQQKKCLHLSSMKKTTSSIKSKDISFVRDFIGCKLTSLNV